MVSLASTAAARRDTLWFSLSSDRGSVGWSIAVGETVITAEWHTSPTLIIDWSLLNSALHHHWQIKGKSPTNTLVAAFPETLICGLNFLAGGCFFPFLYRGQCFLLALLPYSKAGIFGWVNQLFFFFFFFFTLLRFLWVGLGCDGSTRDNLRSTQCVIKTNRFVTTFSLGLSGLKSMLYNACSLHF